MKMKKVLFVLALAKVAVVTCVAAESGWISLFNGRDFSGWIVQCQAKDQLRLRFKDMFVRELDQGSTSESKPSVPLSNPPSSSVTK